MSSKMRLKLGFDLSVLVQYSANTAVMWCTNTKNRLHMEGVVKFINFEGEKVDVMC